MARRGTVYTYSVVHSGTEALQEMTPYVLAVVEDAVAAVDTAVDMSQYDNDHDGSVDAVMIIHTGSGAEAPEEAGEEGKGSGRLPVGAPIP